MKPLAGILAVPVLLLCSIIGLFMLTSGGDAAAACGSEAGSNVSQAVVDAAVVDGVDAEQLGNAAAIMNAAAAAGLPQRAQLIGVMTAIGESSLRNLATGDEGDGVTNPDGSPTCSAGLFQQQWCLGWGTKEQVMDPAYAAKAFFDRLAAVDGWEALGLSAAAHKVQGNADPEHYTAFVELATSITTALAGTGGATPGSCEVGGDAKALAAELVAANQLGKLRSLSYPGQPDHMFEIEAIAAGNPTEDCGIDVRILQVIVLATRNFDSVGVSDINRKCTGQIEGGGYTSSHYINGGGGAVDFYMLNGQNLTGADEQSIALIKLLDPQMPAGSRAGQSDVRADHGTTIPLTNFIEFPDTDNHLHIDVAYADGPLTLEKP